MTETDYLYECNRADLLGLPKPNRDDFFANQVKTTGEEMVEEKELYAEQVEDMGIRQEGFHRISGGLDELNSILSNTQKKINRFKVVCGSFGSLLKLQVGAKKEESEKSVVMDSEVAKETEEGLEKGEKPEREFSQIKQKKDSQLDKLDSLISKAERAELSLSCQNKQMKKFIN